MPAEFIRVRDTRIKGDNILPNRVPRSFLKSFDYLKEVPSGKKRTTVTEPVQPAQAVPVQEPATPADTTTTEPATPEKK